MLRHERAALRTLARQPALFAGGLAVAVAWLLAQVAVGVPLTLVTLPRNTQPLFTLPLAGLVSVVVLPPALAGLYAAVRETRAGEPGAADVLATFAGGVVDHGRDLLVATAWFRVAALLPALAVFAVLLAGDTAVNYSLYASGVGRHPPGILELVLAWGYLLVAGAVGRLALSFYDLPVLFGGATPRRGWRAAARFTRRRPLAVARYGAGRLLLWTPVLAALALESLLLVGSPPAEDPAVLAGLAGAAGLLVAATSTALAAHHVVVYERTVEPELRTPTVAADGTTAPAGTPTDPSTAGRGRPDRSTLFAGVAVLLVVAAGTGAVRVTDARTLPDETGPVGADVGAGAAVENARDLLAGASYRSVSRTYGVNGTTGERTVVIVVRAGVDRRARRAVVSGRIRAGEDDWQRTTVYASETATALNGTGAGRAATSRLPSPFVASVGDGWGLIRVPGYGRIVDAGRHSILDADGADWRVVERRADHLVVGYTERPADHPPEDGETLGARRVRVWIDRDTRLPTRALENRTFVEYENGTAVERRWSVTEVTYEYEGVSVSRPDALGARGPLEWVWDLVYY